MDNRATTTGTTYIRIFYSHSYCSWYTDARGSERVKKKKLYHRTTAVTKNDKNLNRKEKR